MDLRKQRKYWKARKKNLFVFIGHMLPKEEYFEFSIEKSEVTNQTILIVKDFARKKRYKGPKHVMGPPGERTVSPA